MITDVNRKTWTVKAQSIYSAKEFIDMPCMVPYHHNAGGEGFHYLPEIGAQCYVGMPSDNSPAFVIGYIAMPGVIHSESEDPLRSTSAAGGSLTDVSYRGNRPDLNPGDLGFTTRDGNFLLLRRGGIVQLGATGICQRICLPIRNFMKDFAENYEMQTAAGDVAWTVEPPELDPSGNAACQYVFHLKEFAADTSATVRIRHLPLGEHAAWEVQVAPQGINTATGAIKGSVYRMLITTGGDKTEVIGGSRTTDITGDDTLTVKGNKTSTTTGTDHIEANKLELVATALASLVGKKVCIGDPGAVEPGVLGNALLQWFQTPWIVTTVGSSMVASPSPAAIAAFAKVLSTKVFLG